RLERGRFVWPVTRDGKVHLTPAQLSMLLEGIDWEVTDRTVRTWIGEAVAAAAADGVTFSVPVTPHTFRHSYAMHMLYAGIPLKVLQSLMGHKSISSTEVYTKVFALDVAARHRVQFAMPESDAVAMLKQLS
ncbi:tyrosine-type recombinase/integrase, partial [Escherichia coli]|nr:tyrosine-type recombinase/integrase [Escherichia coli]MDI0979783.1 tyrosine-type recombinase/integrase [Escherichia coli]MDI0984791.1 tyrosine-type recombinase/integrase [Escherichia coli]